MKINKRIFTLILCLLVSVLAPANVFAKGYISETTECSISVAYSVDGAALPNVDFCVYHIANTYYNNVSILTNDFNDYSLDIKDLPMLGAQLEVYAQIDNIAPCATATTNSSGMFTVSGLHPGIYLVCGEDVVMNEFKYSCAPTVVYVPATSEDGSRWVYDVTVVPKYEVISSSPNEDEPVDVKVLKVWADCDNMIVRPKSVKVQLVGNGVVLDTVTLSEENGWTYLWQELDGDVEYAVTEIEVPAYYTVSIQQEGITFVITNTSTITPPPSSDPEDEPDLPQTGLLWWPVPVLAVLGTAMITIGFAVKNEDNTECE